MADAKRGGLVWTTKLPMLSNLFLIRDALKVTILAAIAPGFLMLALALWEVDYDRLPIALRVFAIAAIAMATLWLLALLFMGGGATTEFGVNHEGAAYASKSRRLKWAARLAVLGGAARGSAGLATAGAGLIAMGRADVVVRWRDLMWAKCDDRRRLIHLYDSWHTVLRLWCTEEVYENAKAVVREHLPAQRPEDAPRPVAYGWLTLLVVVMLGALVAAPELPLDVPLPLDLLVVVLTAIAGFATRRGVLWGSIALLATVGATTFTFAREQGLDTYEDFWRSAFGVEIAAYAAFALIAIFSIRRGLRR